MKRTLHFRALVALAAVSVLLLAFIVGGSRSELSADAVPVVKSYAAWSFGVMSDTQWALSPDPSGRNPNGVSVSIIKQINRQMISKGVKFVIQVGDLTENGNDADEAVRAQAAQDLYKAGIGFFPMRGNHETYAHPANGYGVSAFQSNYPQTQCISNTFGATNCNSPVAVSTDMKGMSYSFDYGPAGNSARFIIIDTWAMPSKVHNAAGCAYGYTIDDQQAWISSRLDSTSRRTTHAFVFSHQPLIAEKAWDTMFSGYTNANPDWQNAFFASLQINGVRYFVSGHDHMHQRSIIVSPDGKSKVEELICASDSNKFYTPRALNDDRWFGQKTRETSSAQEIKTVGFYVYTVDGPRVTVDYYSDDHGNWGSGDDYPAATGNGFTNKVTPTFNFVKKETWGYSLNGKEFLVGGTNSASYTVVRDKYRNTTAKILSGRYSNKAVDYQGRILTQTVDTGWSPMTTGTSSDILTLWGMTNTLGSDKTDTYALSMSYDPGSVPSTLPRSGKFGLATPGADGKWVNAADRNIGGRKKFVFGPYNTRYLLGTYGVDTKTNTAWAVVNYDGAFAVVRGL
jgi:hypothetical protein